LPEPDIVRPNPHNKNSVMSLYMEDRVINIENTEEFKIAFAKSETRKETSRKSVETKKNKILEWVNDLNIVIPSYDKEVLIEKACEHFNKRKAYQKERYEEWESIHYLEIHQYGDGYDPDFSMSSKNSDPKFLARKTTNYLRHQCTIMKNYWQGCLVRQETRGT
jgi:hypothetical protein